VGGETSATTHPMTQCHNPEDLNLHTQLYFQVISGDRSNVNEKIVTVSVNDLSFPT
jgi:hypothetical protein